MNRRDWKSYWQHHVLEANDDPFSQVGRTKNSIPMTKEVFSIIVGHVVDLLDLKPDQKVLDFCCGNGLFSAHLCRLTNHVVGVDFNQKLIQDLNRLESNNILGIVSDAMEVQFASMTFDRIIFAAAIQHFSESQVILLFRRFRDWLRPGGKLLVAEITDRRAIWDFYNTKERKAEYFNATMVDASLLGTWFDRDWLQHLSEFVGFTSVEIFEQPEEYWYSHYRFDLLAVK